MIELRLKKEQDYIEFDGNTEKGDYCYGVISKNSEKGWMQPKTFESNLVNVRCFNSGVSRCNGWTWFSNDCFNTVCKEWLGCGHKIYRFNNEKELFTWLIED